MYDVIILGSGPAGLTAAIYTARARLGTLVITGPMIGGQIALTYQVDNYPGFHEGITGPDLVQLMRIHAERFGAEFIEEEATAVDFSGRPLRVYLGDEEHQGETIIIATGSISRRLGLESEERLMGRGVFICGDIIDEKYRQAITACGSGCKAALEAERFIDKLRSGA